MKPTEQSWRNRLIHKSRSLILSLTLITSLVALFALSWGFLPLWAAFFATVLLGTPLTFYVITAAQTPDDGVEYGRDRATHQILEIANGTLPYLKTGLNTDSAAKVARIIFERTDAVAVAITDPTTVLGFCGAGHEHHRIGRPILTLSTKQALDLGKTKVLSSKTEIGCPTADCPLETAIVVPLAIRNKPVGALKFYYDSFDKLTANRIIAAEGLAKLLSTQLELSEIDRQKELACHAELRALQAQINPHFLFNALNTIAMFCRTNPKEARRLLVQFADFFRKTLEWKEGQVGLERELDYIECYLELERARFGDRLIVLQDIDEKAMKVQVPALSLQPLVENAIKHGFPKQGKLQISISARCVNGDLKIVVEDNGHGISSSELNKVLDFGYGKGGGIGLSNVNERLLSLYGENYRLRVDSEPGKGAKIQFRVPIMGVAHGA